MASSIKRKADYIIPGSIDIHCEIQAVPFAQLSQMQPGELSKKFRTTTSPRPSAIVTSTAATRQKGGYD